MLLGTLPPAAHLPELLYQHLLGLPQKGSSHGLSPPPSLLTCSAGQMIFICTQIILQTWSARAVCCKGMNWCIVPCITSFHKYIYVCNVQGAGKRKQARSLLLSIELQDQYRKCRSTRSSTELIAKSCLRTAKICGITAVPTDTLSGKNPALTSGVFLSMQIDVLITHI